MHACMRHCCRMYPALVLVSVVDVMIFPLVGHQVTKQYIARMGIYILLTNHHTTMNYDAVITRGSENLKYYAEETKIAATFNSGNGKKISRIYLPESWTGKKVLCLLLEEPDE